MDGFDEEELGAMAVVTNEAATYGFLRKPWPEKVRSLRFRFKCIWGLLFPSVPLPVRLPYGGWWLARNDVCSDSIFTGGFEEPEQLFVGRFLREGMMVLDIGAHHGFYTMLAARKVGSKGRVIAFEPSSRERERLLRHLKLNSLCAQVVVSPLALGRDNGECELYVVEGRNNGCNSLRPPIVTEPTRVARVLSSSLDRFLREAGVDRVDFIKLDTEGAELEVLEGAKELLWLNPRPVILAEVDDSRAASWGHPAAAVYDFLSERGFYWWRLSAAGNLVRCPRTDRYSGNLVALPEERVQETVALMEVRAGEADSA